MNKKIITLLSILSLAFVAPLFAFAADATTTPVKVQSNTVISTTTISCVQAALDKRETALITAHDAYSTAVDAALTKRLAGLKDAWAQTDKKVRTQKRQDAYKAFKTDLTSASSALKTARNTTWKTFETDAKACGIKGGTGEAPTMILNPNLSL